MSDIDAEMLAWVVIICGVLAGGLVWLWMQW